MAHDDRSMRPQEPMPDARTARPGWEHRKEPEEGWERRNERHDRLREGQDHPLHHGRTLHGNHAVDGDDDSYSAEEKSRIPRVP